MAVPLASTKWMSWIATFGPGWAGGKELGSGYGVWKVHSPLRMVVRGAPDSSTLPQISTSLRNSTRPASPKSNVPTRRTRSEEHTSELQSLAYLVCRLLLEKKKKKLARMQTAEKYEDYDRRR